MIEATDSFLPLHQDQAALAQFCSCSVAKSCPTLCDPMDCSTPGFPSFTNSQSLLKLMSIQSVMPSNHPSSLTPFSYCPQSSPASGSFPMCWLFPSAGQSIGASASASVLPMNIQSWFPLGLTGLISLLSKGLKSLLQHHIWKHQFGAQPSSWSNSHIHTWLLEKL